VPAPNPPVGTVWSNVAGVGLLSNGHLIVAERMPMYALLEYDRDNRLIRSFGANIVGRVHGMRIDGDDNIWLTDQTCGTVLKLNSRGEVLLTLGTKGKSGTWNEATGDHLFNQPTDIGFGRTGDIYVTTGHGGPDPRVVRFNKAGKFITTWSLAHPDGTPATIHTIVVDRDDTVYVGDREAKVIRVFDRTGRALRDITMPNLICGLFIDAKGGLWMTTGQDGMIMQIDRTGRILGWSGKEGFASEDYGEAHYLTVSPDLKTIYVGDTVNNDIKRLERTAR
jgi:sugar lactone lactonase YvrE